MDRISYYSLEEGQGIKLVGIGKVDGDALVAAVKTFLEDLEALFARCEFWVSDYSRLDGSNILPVHARAIADLSLQSGKKGLISGTYAPGTLEFGMTRLWGSLADETNWELGVFGDAQELADWLNTKLGRSVDLDGRKLLVEFPGQLNQQS